MSGSVKFIVEAIYSEEEKKRCILPMVHKFNVARNHAAKRRWGLGSVPTFQFSGVRSHRVVIAGKSGLRTRFDTEGVTAEAAADMTGPALFRRVEAFFLEFERRAAEAQKVSDGFIPKLKFYALWEQKAFLCEHKKFEFVRDAGSSRFQYEYTLELESYADIDRPQPSPPISWLRDALSFANKVTETINAVSVAIAQVDEFLQDVLFELNVLRQPAQAVSNMLLEVDKLIGTVGSITQWPQAFLSDYFDVVERAIFTAFDAWNTLDIYKKTNSRATMLKLLTALADSRSKVLGVFGARGFKVAPPITHAFGKTPAALNATYSAIIGSSTGTSNVTTIAGKVVKPYTMNVGDSLSTIAQKLLGDASLWPEIASLNGMVHPNALSDGSPLLPGSIIYVPFSSPPDALNTSDVYSTDIFFDMRDGSAVWGGVYGEPQDLKTVSGVDNLVQGLSLRLLTVEGQNKTFPTMGLPKLIGQSAVIDKIAEAALAVRQQLLADTRVSDILSLSVEDRGNVIVGIGKIRTAVGGPIDIALPLVVKQ